MKRQVEIVQPPESGDVYTPAAVDSLIGQHTMLLVGDASDATVRLLGLPDEVVVAQIVTAELKSDGIHMTVEWDA